MKIKLAALLVAALVAFVAFGYIEAADQKSEFQGQDVGASASFFAVGPDGMQVYTYVFASDYTSKNNGVSSTGSSLWLDIFMVDVGDPENYEDNQFHEFLGSVELSSGDLVVSKDLSSATLFPVDVGVCEFIFYEDDGSLPEPECLDVAIKMNWVDTGSLARDWGDFHRDDSVCRSNSSFDNSYRDAVATGSIIFGGQELPYGPADFAAVSSSSYKDNSRGCIFDPCADGLADAKMEGRGRDFVPPALSSFVKQAAGCPVP